MRLGHASLSVTIAQNAMYLLLELFQVGLFIWATQIAVIQGRIGIAGLAQDLR